MANLITEPGLYRLAPSVYHGDPSATPSLSSSVAKLLAKKKPRHAWYAHPRLNPFYDDSGNDENKRKTAFGSACHELALGIHEGEKSVVQVIDADNYSKGKDGVAAANRKKRDDAIAAGHVPVLKKDFERAKGVVDAAMEQLTSWFDFDGESEVAGIAHFDRGVTRFMCDRLLKNKRTIVDLKFSEVPATLEEWPKQAVRMNYHISAGHYRQGLASILGIDVRHTEFLFAVVEIGPPTLVIVHELPPGLTEIGMEMADNARQTWAFCLKNGTDMEHWPGYGPGIHQGDDPGWAIAQWEGQKALAELEMTK